MNDSTSTMSETASVTMAVVAAVQVRQTLQELTELRRGPGDRFEPEVTASWLKTQDEHSMCTLLAVSAAIRRHDLHDTDFAQWGIVTANRFIGRRALLNSIERFKQDGPWGASLHVVPMHSPHSPSGALSLSLGSNGPNLSSGSGLGANAEAILIAASLMTQHDLPGLWLVLTEWENDCDESDSNDPSRFAICCATALALRPADAATQFGWLMVHGLSADSLAQDTSDFQSDDAALTDLLTTITALGDNRFGVEAPLGGGLWLRYQPERASVRFSMESTNSMNLQTGR